MNWLLTERLGPVLPASAFLTDSGAPSEGAAGKHEDPKGGLNAAGRKHFGVKKGVTNYSSASEEDKKRWVRWALRFTKNPKPLKKDGKVTRYALMFRAWGEPVPSSPAAVSAVHKKAETRAKQLKMGEHANDETWLHSSENDFWEDVVKMDDDAAEEHTGAMIALYPSPEQALELAIPGGEHPDELHVTLAYLGQLGAELADEDEQRIIQAVTQWARSQPAITATVSGVGFFDQDPPVTYASIDAWALPSARQRLVETLDGAAVRHAQEHGFTPHMTIAYEQALDYRPARLAMHFHEVHVRFAGRNTIIPLQGGAERVQVNEPEAAKAIPEPAAPRPQEPRAFTIEINGRQLVAGPASTSLRLESAAMREPSIEEIAEEPLLWMHGRFVGSEEANRNGAMWSSGDLQLATEGVAHGPLNWLHEARHIIGTIATSHFVPQETSANGELVHPHITAGAAIWRWVYPDEAFVVQQASDLGQLWYSMECISSDITCTGPNGCGNSTTYSQYTSGAACEHVLQRASVRQFNNPVFLGGAVIVPPSRPGWAQADASVMRTAGRIAEAAYDQSFAGQSNPDMRASDWESLMAQLVAFASR